MQNSALLKENNIALLPLRLQQTNRACHDSRGIVNDLRRTKSECAEKGFGLSFGHHSHCRSGCGIYGAFVPDLRL